MTRYKIMDECNIVSCVPIKVDSVYETTGMVLGDNGIIQYIKDTFPTQADAWWHYIEQNRREVIQLRAELLAKVQVKEDKFLYAHSQLNKLFLLEKQ